MLKLTILLAVLAIGQILANPVNHALKQKLQKGTANIIISFDETFSVLSQVRSRNFATRGDRITAMQKALEVHAANSQKHVLEALMKAKAKDVKSWWINNRIFVRDASLELVESLSTMSGITEIREEQVFPVPQVERSTEVTEGRALEWGVRAMRADTVWGSYNGSGVVVAITDTGVRASHECLRNNMRRQYHWMDPYTHTPEPMDANGHGTHVMGSICGQGGTGVAPGAEWVACRGCDTSQCAEHALTTCGQWTLCPTRPDGSERNCSMAPDLSSNSWGGGQGDTWYNSVIQAWNDASITPLFAIGNSGPFCRTANSPGDQDGLISVGATNAQDSVTQFSSHGPVLGDINKIKPEVAAPGNNIRSASHTSDTGYVLMSGTSMACPHAAGLVALLKNKLPTATFQQILNVTTSTAVRPFIADTPCGNVNISDPWPNHSYGWGRVDARNALMLY